MAIHINRYKTLHTKKKLQCDGDRDDHEWNQGGGDEDYSDAEDDDKTVVLNMLAMMVPWYG